MAVNVPARRGRGQKVAIEESTSRANLVRPYRLAISACALSLVLVLCSGLLAFLNDMLDPHSWFGFVGLTSAAVGGVVASKKPANPVGWLFLGAALGMTLQEFARQWAIYGLATEPGALPFGRAAASVAIWAGPLGAALLFVILPLHFPNGRPVSPRWRPVIRLVALALAADLLLYSLMPDVVVYGTDIANPLGIEALRPGRSLLNGAALALWLGLIFVAVASLVARFRRSGGEERQQLKWFMYAVSMVLVWFCTNWPLEEAIPDLFPLLDSLVISGIPLAAGIAVLKYRLYDIDLVINRTLVYGALTACVIGIYVLVVGYLGALLRTDGNLAISLVATGLVAILFQPLRYRLQRSVNRLMYGERDDPYGVLSRLGQRLEGTLDPQTALRTIVETVTQALKLPYAAIELERNGTFEKAAEHGTPKGKAVELPLMHQGEEVGRLLVSARSPGEAFSSQDRRLLADLARQAGSAAHAARLAADLKRSRERLVTTREEERRRLRRDLHDGLGPRLATLALKHDAARNLLVDDPEAVDRLLAELKGETKEAIAEVRRVVHDLRPPALDQLGLVPALEGWTRRQGNGETRIAVEAPQELPPLPAAVEVACYRIVQEAVTNVVRHAAARECVVSLNLNEETASLIVEVSDDGRGIGVFSGSKGGVGMHSMRERAEELGGSFEVGPAAGGGTVVRARLPLDPGGEDAAHSAERGGA
jgi:signal transduction histidine kinase